MNGQFRRFEGRPVYAIRYEPMPLTRLALRLVLFLLRIDMALALPGDGRQRLLLKVADWLFRRLGMRS